MFGLGVIEGMNLSGHPWIINEIYMPNKKEKRLRIFGRELSQK